MRTIWKFEIDLTGVQTVLMPRNADVIDAAHQHPDTSKLSVWALVDSDAEMEPRVIHVVGTGHRAPPSVGPTDLIASVLMRGAYEGLVFHVFVDPIDRGVMTKEMPAQHRAITK